MNWWRIPEAWLGGESCETIVDQNLKAKRY